MKTAKKQGVETERSRGQAIYGRFAVGQSAAGPAAMHAALASGCGTQSQRLRRARDFFDTLLGPGVKFLVSFLELARSEVGIDLRRGDIHVSQEFLYCAQVCLVLQQVCRE